MPKRIGGESNVAIRQAVARFKRTIIDTNVCDEALCDYFRNEDVAFAVGYFVGHGLSPEEAILAAQDVEAYGW